MKPNIMGKINRRALLSGEKLMAIKIEKIQFKTIDITKNCRSDVGKLNMDLENNAHNRKPQDKVANIGMAM